MSREYEVKVEKLREEMRLREVRESMLLAAYEALTERVEALEEAKPAMNNAVVEGGDVKVPNGKLKKAHR
jgi:aminoglycoside phosphotransferase